MMQQVNALRRLEQIFDTAINNEVNNKKCGIVLLEAMNLPTDAENLTIFYEILVKAKDETISCKIPKIERHISTLDELNSYFITNHPWALPWETFAGYLHKRNIISVLGLLADRFESQNPSKFLEEEFLTGLQNELNSLLDEITDSDLSKEIKNFLIRQLEGILIAIRRYYVDGTKGLELAVKSLFTDLVITEQHSSVSDKDKSNPVLKKVEVFATLLLRFITPNAYDIIGLVPVFDEYYNPKINEYYNPKINEFREKYDHIVDNYKTSTISQILDNGFNQVNRENVKNITGAKEQKKIPPSNQDSQEN